MNQPIFELSDVHYSYLGKFPALRGVELSIGQGRRVALMGANGCGKSTLLMLLDGLLFADQGSVRYRGKDIREADLLDESASREFRRGVGLVFQNPDVQLFCPTVREDIAFGPLQLGAEQGAVQRRVEELAETLKIGHLLDRSPHQLSIGEKRKVAFASTLAVDPDVLLLDEPTAGLDPMTTTHILELLLAASRAGKTIVTATHDIHIAGDIADEVYILGQDKHVAAHGAPDELLKDEALLQANNLLHAHFHRHRDKLHAHPHQDAKHHV